MKPDSVRVGQNVTLTCDTSCTLPGLTQIVWYKNGQPVAKPPHFQAGAGDAGSYTCAVKGQEFVQSNPVFLDVQCEYINDTVMGSKFSTMHYLLLKDFTFT